MFCPLWAALLLGVSVPAVAQIYTPPTEGLVACWSGDGNGNDGVGGHNGTVGGSVGYVSGVFGQAFNFPGGYGASRVTVADNDAFKLTSSLTISAWVNPRPTGDNWVVLWRGDSRVGLDPYNFSFQPGGQLNFSINDAAGNFTMITTPAAPSLYQWHQVTATLDGDSGDMRLYVDGSLAVEAYTAVRPFGDLDPARNPGLCIGNVIGGTFPFVGYIDEVLLYSRALTPTEVALLAVPEPSSLALISIAGAVCLACRSRSSRR